MRTTTFTTEQRIKRRKDYLKEWHEKRKSDPEYLEKMRQTTRKWYAEMKKDQQRFEEYKEKRRAYYQQRKNEIHGQSAGESD